VPAGGAPDPVDRCLLRWILAEAGTRPLVVAVVEPVLGSHAAPELHRAGVTTVFTGPRTGDWLVRHRASIHAALVADRALAATLGFGRLATLPPLWLFGRSSPRTDPPEAIEDDERPGRATLVAIADERDSAVVRAAVATIPSVPAPNGDDRAAPMRGPGRALVVVGELVRRPAATAEGRMRWVLDEVVPRVRVQHPTLSVEVVAVDGFPSRRAIVGSTAVRPEAAWTRCSDAAAVIVCDESDDPSDDLIDELIGELRAAGIDPVVIGPDQALDDVVAAATVALARSVRHDAPPPTVWRAPSRQGTLAAHDAVAERFAREAYGSQQLPWVRSLIANQTLAVDECYRRWWRVHHGNPERADVIVRRAERLTHRPLISVVVPVFDTEPGVLHAMFDSVRLQAYSNWELCLADDGSSDPDTIAALAAIESTDGRVRVHRSAAGGGIVAATNAALAMARGAFVAFVDHDDVLAPDALYWVARRLALDPSLDIVYSDEDKLDHLGRRIEPAFKPDWSPDQLLSFNYITHLLVVRRRLLDHVGGLRPGFDGAQDYDLVLRLVEHTDRIAHVPAPVYSWRKVAGSTAADIHAKPAAHAASDRAVDEALVRRGVAATREPGVQPTWHRVRYRRLHDPLVSVVIPTRDRVDLLRPCIERVRATVAYPHLEFVIVDNESSDPATLDYLCELDAECPDVVIVRYPHRFNFARMMNLAAMTSTGEVLLLLNNDVRPLCGGWFEALLEHALRPEVGAVGARLRWPDGRAQHEGIVLNAGGVALNLDSGPYDSYGACIRNVAAVTGACLMTRTTAFAAVGGMDERLRVAYNDVDLCLRLGEAGFRVIYTPYAELEHAESSTRGKLHPTVDEQFFQQRWGPPGTAIDPFASPNLELMQPWSPRL
jgi:GT2 family glycosyltransferase